MTSACQDAIYISVRLDHLWQRDAVDCFDCCVIFQIMIMRYNDHVQRCRTLLDGAVDDKKKKTNCPLPYHQNPGEVLEEFLGGDVLWVPGTLGLYRPELV